MERIYLFDTTLRDGEQTIGVNLNAREKVELALQLANLGIDIIEAGFPNSSKGDYQATLEVAKAVKGVTVAGLCRTVASDIQRAWEALRYAEQPRIHIVIATSEVHMLHKLRMSEQEVIDAAVAAIKLAKGYCGDVEFSCEDASRSEPAFLYRILEKAIAAGATTVNLPDTVGYATPPEHYQFIRDIIERVPNIHKAVLSAHCHDDLGLAVANSLAAVEAGARQVEGTINGLGERAGNAALEEIIMALTTRADYYQLQHRAKTEQIYRTCHLVGKYTGQEIPPGKAIVGDNAFRHGSGIHQHGVMQERTTYEIMTAESIGRYEVEGIVLGKLSGRHAFEEKVRELGFHLDEADMKYAFEKFKQVADRKKDVRVKDIMAIIEGRLGEVPATVELVNYQILSANNISSTATVQLRQGGEESQLAAIAGGPVDAAFKAITELVGLDISLEAYNIKAVTEGTDALGEVTVRVRYQGGSYMGKGVSTDVIKSSMLAYINAINRIYAEGMFQ